MTEQHFVLLYRCRLCGAVKHKNPEDCPLGSFHTRDEAVREAFHHQPYILHTCPSGDIGVMDIAGGRLLSQETPHD